MTRPIPWGLTPHQSQALRLLAACGCRKEVCSRLGIGEQALSVHVRRAVEKMGALNDMHAVLMWDRWDRDGIVSGLLPALAEQERTRANAALLRNLDRCLSGGLRMSLGIYDNRCQGRVMRAAGGGHLANECTDCLRRTQVPADVKSVPWYPKPPAIPRWWATCQSYVGPRADEVAGD